MGNEKKQAELTPYELWQLEKYGNIIQEKVPLFESEEFESTQENETIGKRTDENEEEFNND